MPTLDALIGGAGYARADWGHWRTNTAWSRWALGKLNSTDPGADGVLMESRRQLNHDPNTGVLYDDSADAFDLEQNLSQIATMGAVSTAWRIIAETCDGAGAVTARAIDLATATQVAAATALSTSSLYGHGQPQWTYFGARFDGSSASLQWPGLWCLMGAVKGVELSQAWFEGLAADPLAVLDLLVQTYAGNPAVTVYAVDDSLSDIGAGVTPTLLGGLSWGSGNGPAVADRATVNPSDDPVIASVSGISVLYDGENRVTVTGSNFGADEGEVRLSDDPQDPAGELQVVRSWSDTQVVFSVSVTTTGGARTLRIVNKTAGDPGVDRFDDTQVTVNADPGDVIAVRGSIAPINLSSGMSTNFDAAPYFYARPAQDTRTFSYSGLPTGITGDTSTGELDGTPTTPGSYAASVTLTDQDGAQATAPFLWTISSALPTATSKLPGTWGRREPRSSV